MILYLDTSAWVKLYAEEVGSDLVREAVRDAAHIATHLIAYVEMQSALARKRSESSITDDAFTRVSEEVLRDWKHLHRLPVDEALVFRAAELAQHERLRGFDAVHLAAADRLRSIVATRVKFATFDRPLNRAAANVGFDVLAIPPE